MTFLLESPNILNINNRCECQGVATMNAEVQNRIKNAKDKIGHMWRYL